ncbi:D-alanine--D-alanine ligase [Haloimpatiens lingqiaonensis]|uniref:D-alanine--D-alanine ligase n=1 Tax=Haloimpatiens lingqiaonensis TaxID=1380675 RepID=UPI0010FD8806|nr:D-alanine--D-alanine ligase [Haloimpatiens lingqiaonensis]
MQVGVIMGGISSERDVSMLSGEAIIENLDKNKYEVLPIPVNTQYQLIDMVRCLDFAFIALHGQFGEDGTVQGILKSMGVPFTGSDVLSSALCMDKNITKELLRTKNINTPDWVMIKKGKAINFHEVERIAYPLVVKPNNGGSSIGISIVKNREEFQKAIEQAFKYDEEVMIEEYIDGEELTCCMLDGKILPVLSIKPKEDVWFDYNSKYTAEGADEVVAELNEDIMRQIEVISKKCWEIFKLKAYGRIDIMMRNNKVYVLEINTLPGMTKNSLFPKSARAAGMSFSQLLDKIIQCSLEE